MAATDTDDATTRIRTEALRLFARVGFGSTTIDDIAEAAGVGVATIYRRWDDKSALANDLFATILEAMETTFVVDLPPTPKRAFATLWRALWTFALDDPDRFLFLEGQVPDPWISATNRERKLAFKGQTSGLLDAAGVKADPGVAEAIIMGTITALLRAGNHADADELGARLWQALRTAP